MCLDNVAFSMRYWREYDTYVGTGYKSYGKYSPMPPLDTWIEASGQSTYETIPNRTEEVKASLKKYGISKVYPMVGNKYPAGFHIFTSLGNARHYRSGPSNIYKVDFTDVIAFGENNTSLGKAGDCVIARWMYVHSTPVATTGEKQ